MLTADDKERVILVVPPGNGTWPRAVASDLEARGAGVVLVDSCEAITPSVDAAEISGVMPVRMNRAMRRAKASQARKQGGKTKRTIVLHDPNARRGGGR